jgi:hypothetical protein
MNIELSIKKISMDRIFQRARGKSSLEVKQWLQEPQNGYFFSKKERGAADCRAVSSITTLNPVASHP